MRRVLTIYYVRPLFSWFVICGLVLGISLWGLGREVWVAQVFSNGPRGFFNHSLYIVYAFENTRLVVQALTLLSVASVVYLARECARIIANIFVPTRA